MRAAAAIADTVSAETVDCGAAQFEPCLWAAAARLSDNSEKDRAQNCSPEREMMKRKNIHNFSWGT
jgi:hypothetical protein